MKNNLKVMLLAIFCGFIGSIVGVYVFQKTMKLGFQEHMANYYAEEMATVVSPADVKNLIDKKRDDYILVDLRSKGEYETEHMVTAINIPAVTMSQAQVLAAFKSLPQNKQIIVHCYSGACTLGRQVGNYLAQNGVYVKDLDIGWSEWKYFWSLWNPGDDNKAGENYVIKGTKQNTVPGICTQGEFGC